MIVSSADHSFRDAAFIAGLYLLFAIALTQATAAASAALGRVQALAVLPVAGFVVWHARECFQVPETHLEFAGAWLALAALLVPLGRRLGACCRVRWSLWAAAGAGGLLCVFVGVGFPTLNTLRWHVLRHHTTFGMPLYHALATPVDEVVRHAWEEAGRRTATGMAATFAPPAEPTPALPNLVFVLVDTLRADRLAAYGGAADKAPNLNAFAARGLVFADVQTNASWTRPAVGSMMTGLLQEHHGAVDRTDRLRTDIKTVAEQLKARGYQTVAFVTNYAAVAADAGFGRGFDQFIEVTPESGEENHAYVQSYAPVEVVNQRVGQWLQQRAQSARREPLFLYVHYLDPHEPYMAAPPPSRRHARLLAAYDADVAHFDNHFPALLADVQRHITPAPLIVFTSDHGEEFGEHGARGHGSGLSPEQLHVPLVVAGPGVEPAVTDSRLEGRDLFSLLDLLSAGRADQLRGWAREHDRSSRYASVFLTTKGSLLHPQHSQVGMRSFTQQGRVLVWSAYGETYELYDLTLDPDRRDNLFEARPAWSAPLLSGLRRPIHTAVEAPKNELSIDSRMGEALRALGYAE